MGEQSLDLIGGGGKIEQEEGIGVLTRLGHLRALPPYHDVGVFKSRLFALIYIVSIRIYLTDCIVC
jgi:hypothetical protein